MAAFFEYIQSAVSHVLYTYYLISPSQDAMKQMMYLVTFMEDELIKRLNNVPKVVELVGGPIKNLSIHLSLLKFMLVITTV